MPTRASLPSTEQLGRLKPYVYRYVVWVPYYLFPSGPKFINMGIPGKLVTYSHYFAADTFTVRNLIWSTAQAYWCRLRGKESLKTKNKLFTVSRSK